MFKFFPLNGGVFVSIICAIHCAATPLLLSILPTFAGNFAESELLEWGMVALGLLLSGYTLLKGYQQHHNPRPFQLLGVAGILFIVANAFLHSHTFSWAHTLTNLSGGLLLIISQRINHTSKVSCTCKAH